MVVKDRQDFNNAIPLGLKKPLTSHKIGSVRGVTSEIKGKRNDRGVFGLAIMFCSTVCYSFWS